jgi:hypothetical protein
MWSWRECKIVSEPCIEQWEHPMHHEGILSGRAVVSGHIHCRTAVIASRESSGTLHKQFQYICLLEYARDVPQLWYPPPISVLEKSWNVLCTRFFPLTTKFPLSFFYGCFGFCCSFHVIGVDSICQSLPKAGWNAMKQAIRGKERCAYRRDSFGSCSLSGSMYFGAMF